MQTLPAMLRFLFSHALIILLKFSTLPFQKVMQGKRDSITDGSVGPVGQLVRVQLMTSGCLEGPENQALEHFHDHGGQSDWSGHV